MSNLAIIRKDIQEDESAVPVWEGIDDDHTQFHYHSDTRPVEYRWLKYQPEDEDEDRFQVLIDGQWLDAYSIDWEFI